MKNILLYVGHKTDKVIIDQILQAANYPTDRINIVVAGGQKNVIKLAIRQTKVQVEDRIVAAIIDGDSNYVQESIQKAKTHLIGISVEVFCAIPTVEAWVFADDLVLKKYIPQRFQREADRIPMPEEIFYPELLLHRWFNGKDSDDSLATYHFLSQIDIARAASRCPSLSYFLRQIGELLALPEALQLPIENALANALPKRIFANLLEEVALPNTVIYRTLDGNQVTVDDLRKAIWQDSQMGKEYIGRVFRVARDIIKNQATK